MWFEMGLSQNCCHNTWTPLHLMRPVHPILVSHGLLLDLICHEKWCLGHLSFVSVHQHDKVKEKFHKSKSSSWSANQTQMTRRGLGATLYKTTTIRFEDDGAIENRDTAMHHPSPSLTQNHKANSRGPSPLMDRPQCNWKCSIPTVTECFQDKSPQIIIMKNHNARINLLHQYTTGFAIISCEFYAPPKYYKACFTRHWELFSSTINPWMPCRVEKIISNASDHQY